MKYKLRTWTWGRVYTDPIYSRFRMHRARSRGFTLTFPQRHPITGNRFARRLATAAYWRRFFREHVRFPV